MAKAPDALETIAWLSSQLAKKSQTLQRLKRLNTKLTAELADSEASRRDWARQSLSASGILNLLKEHPAAQVLVEQSMKLCGVVKVD